MGLFFSDKQTRLLKELHRACEHSDAAKAQQAIAAGADVNGYTWKLTPLQRAVSHEFVEGVRMLVEAKADLKARDDEGRTILMMAAQQNSPEVVRLLLDAGADVNAARNDGKTALHIAAQRGRGDIVKVLLAKGADPKAADFRMNTPADMARTYYSRIADLITAKEKELDKQKEPAQAKPVVQASASLGWRLTARDEVSNVTERAEIGYRLTEIFNFGSGIYTRIARNLNTGAESQSLRFFDEFADRTAIDRAQQALTRLGGEVPEEARSKLGKPSLTPRPQGGTP